MSNHLIDRISSKWFRLSVGIAISGLTLYLALKNVPLQEVGSVLKQSDLWLIGLAVLSVGLNTIAKSFRWQVLLDSSGKKIGFITNLGALLVGQMLNLFMPARVGELSRIYLIGNQGVGRTFTLGTIVIEKALDMISYAFLFICLILLIPLPMWMTDSGYTFAGITVIVALVIGILTIRREWISKNLDRWTKWIPKRFQEYIQPRIQAGLSSLNILINRKDFLKLLIWSIVIWGTAVWTNQLVLQALDIEIPFTAPLLILIALQVGISIPFIPGKIGIFEYICVLALSVYSITQPQAVGYGILLHGVVFIPPTIFGLLYLALNILAGQPVGFANSK